MKNSLWVLSRTGAFGKNRITHKGHRTPEGNQRGERWPASSPGCRGQRPIISAGTAEEAIALGTSWVAGVALKPHAGSSDGDTAIEHLSEIVTWSVLVWFARQRGMENWVCDGLVNVRGAADGLLCASVGAVGPRAAAAPVALSLGNNGGSYL